MNFPEYWNSVWTDPQFQALDPGTRLFFFAAASQVDIAGWWYPHPQLTPLQIPGIDVAAAVKSLDPWVQAHPSGFLALRGYVRVQAPNGLNPMSGMHRGIQKRLVMHQTRERRVGGSPENIEGLESEAGSTSGGVDLAAPPKVGSKVTQAVPPRDPQSSKSQVPSSESQVQSPTGESEGDAVPQPELDGQTVELTPLPDRPGVDDIEGVWAGFRMFNVDVYNPAPWKVGILKEAAKVKGWRRVKDASISYLSSPDSGPSRSLEAFVRTIGQWMRQACKHTDLEWWTFAVDKRFPVYGMKSKRTRCRQCNHAETRHDLAWIPDHDHDYVDQAGPGMVMGDLGTVVRVPRWQECRHCGHGRAHAIQALLVAA